MDALKDAVDTPAPARLCVARLSQTLIAGVSTDFLVRHATPEGNEHLTLRSARLPSPLDPGSLILTRLRGVYIHIVLIVSLRRCSPVLSNTAERSELRALLPPVTAVVGRNLVESYFQGDVATETLCIISGLLRAQVR